VYQSPLGALSGSLKRFMFDRRGCGQHSKATSFVKAISQTLFYTLLSGGGARARKTPTPAGLGLAL
jgi:hypothetical protein